ncbi:tetratricopeptide repeat protein [Kriegella sp. EG-1]|nr:tetratricopeptide repeat protein [Flavobacteriaceae bacterium EG-1]
MGYTSFLERKCIFKSNQTTMKPKIIFWFLFVCVISPPLCAQQNQKQDSLLKKYNQQEESIEKVKTIQELFYSEMYSTPEKARAYAQEGIEMSKRIKYESGEGVGYYHLGSFYQVLIQMDSARYFYKKSAAFWEDAGDTERLASTISSLGTLEKLDGNYDKAQEMYDQAITMYKEAGNISHMANAIASKASVHSEMGNYRLALIQALESLRLRDSLNTKPWRKADVLRQVGQIENQLKNYKSAIHHFESAATIYSSINDNVYLGHAYSDLGTSYFELSDFDNAILNYENSLGIADSLDIPDMRQNALSNLGMVYSKMGQYDKGISYLEKALSKERKRNSLANHISNLIELGHAWNRKGNPDKGIGYLNKAIYYADSIKASGKSLLAYGHRARAHEILQDFQNSTKDLKKYQQINDSIYNTTKSQQIEELRTIYDTEKKEQQIALQEKEITVLEQKAEISNLQKLIMGIGLLLSLIGFYAIRQKMKRNRLEREKVEIELEFKKKELTTHALNLARKNETLENLKLKAQELKEKENTGTGYNQLIRSINFDLQDDNNWENFSRYFEEVHKDFNSNVKTKYPEVTSNELRLLALLKMNLSSKEIANILNISAEGIKKARYRLRKKLDLSTEDSLQDLVLSL